MNWVYETPVTFPPDLKSNSINWNQKMVSFNEISHYPNDSVKEIHLTFSIPSFIGPPSIDSKKFKSILLPKIGQLHILSIVLPEEYPLLLIKTNIRTVTTLWHNNFYYQKSGYAHGCVLISGEIDGMTINLFQQLLWNPEFVFQKTQGDDISLNKEALRYTLKNGRNFLYLALLDEMNDNYSKNSLIT